MRRAQGASTKATNPQFMKQASELAGFMKLLDQKDIAKIMRISPKLSEATKILISSWSSNSSKQTHAIDSFLGDIYSGLQAHNLDVRDRNFAQKHLRIVSGLYGILKPLDGIFPYRLEMAYKLPDERYSNLYRFWGDALAKSIEGESILNLTSAEYSKAVLPYVGDTEVVTPRFLTFDSNAKENKFVVVHAKIARGTFANWLIKERITSLKEVVNFNAIGYKYNEKLSTQYEPVFVAKKFDGLGLSVRLK